MLYLPIARDLADLAQDILRVRASLESPIIEKQFSRLLDWLCQLFQLQFTCIDAHVLDSKVLKYEKARILDPAVGRCI